MRIENEPVSPRPESIDLIDECIGQIGSDDSELADWFAFYARVHRRRLAFDVDIIERFLPSGSSVLDVGANPLLFTAAVAKRGYRVTGLDLAPERSASSAAKLGLNILKCNIEHELFPVGDGEFQAVVFNEVFEHLRINLIFTMQQVFRVLAPNGVLILSTPNLKSLSGLTNFLLHGRATSCVGDIYSEYEKLSKLGHMGHVREYTTVEVTTFLQRIGFSVEDMLFRGPAVVSRKAHVLYSVFPRLRPFVSYIARKPL